MQNLQRLQSQPRRSFLGRFLYGKEGYNKRMDPYAPQGDYNSRKTPEDLEWEKEYLSDLDPKDVEEYLKENPIEPLEDIEATLAEEAK